MIRIRPCVAFAACMATLLLLGPGFGQDKSVSPGKSTEAKKSDIPIDPVQRLAYEYGAQGRFGITGIFIAGKNRMFKQLTFSRDGATNMTVVQVDGETTPFGGTAGQFTVMPQYKGGKPGQKYFSTGTWLHQKNVEVTQILDIVPGQVPIEVAPKKFKRFLNTCLVTYVLENQDTKPHKVGLRIEIDTLIGQNDGVPFTVPGLPGLVTTKHDFVGAEKVPGFIQAVEVPDLRNPGTIAQMTLKVGRGLEAPSRVSLTRWTNGFAGWDVPVVDMAGDSAVILYWEPTELQPKEKRTLGFAYGLGSIASQEDGALGVTVSGTFVKGEPFVVVATVAKPAAGEKLTLVLPAGLERTAGDNTQPAASADMKGASVVTWSGIAKSAGRYRVEVRSSEGAVAGQTITIVDPEPLQKALGK